MRELQQIKTNEIIKIEEHNGQHLVNARELHEFLESKRDFSTWIKDRIKKFEFIENEDYTSFHKIVGREKGGTTRKEYALTIDTAKELSMVENNEKGREARRYFIEAEKQLRQKSLKTPSKLEYAQMLLQAEIEKENEKQRTLLYKDKGDRLEKMVEIQNERFCELDKRNENLEDHFNSDSGFPIRTIANELGMTAQQLNNVLHKIGLQYKQGKNWYLYTKHLNKGYVVTSYVPKIKKNGETISIRQMRWTQKGREMIHKAIHDLRIDPEMRRKFNISEDELEMNCILNLPKKNSQ